MVTNKKLRKRLIKYGFSLKLLGLNVNSSGNLSVRAEKEGEEGFLITPSGMSYEKIKSEDISFVRLSDGRAYGKRSPSSEWQLHAEIYKHRKDISSIVHTHSPYATVIACLEEDIPPFHYMTAVSGADRIPCAGYATFGTEDLADSCLQALGENGKCCLLSHHGVVSCGSSVKTAFERAVEIENLARIWVQLRQLGGCRLLDSQEMSLVIEKFKSYGQREK